MNHVRETHPDFALSKTDSLHQSPPTTFQVLRHGNTDEFQRGLIILIENSTTIRQQVARSFIVMHLEIYSIIINFVS